MVTGSTLYINKAAMQVQQKLIYHLPLHWGETNIVFWQVSRLQNHAEFWKSCFLFFITLCSNLEGTWCHLSDSNLFLSAEYKSGIKFDIFSLRNALILLRKATTFWNRGRVTLCSNVESKPLPRVGMVFVIGVIQIYFWVMNTNPGSNFTFVE